MGASQSTSSVDIVNNSIITAITNNVNNCSASSTQTQTVQLGGIGIGNSISQSASLNISCLQKVTMTTQLSTQIAQQIQQDATASAVALLPSYSGSSNTTKLANYIQTKVTTNIIQNCATSALQNQNIATSGIQIGDSVNQTLNLFSSCLQNALNNNNISQGVVANIAQTSTATTSNPLDFLSNIFGSITNGIIFFIAFIILIIVIVFVYKHYSNSPAQVQDKQASIAQTQT